MDTLQNALYIDGLKDVLNNPLDETCWNSELNDLDHEFDSKFGVDLYWNGHNLLERTIFADSDDEINSEINSEEYKKYILECQLQGKSYWNGKNWMKKTDFEEIEDTDYENQMTFYEFNTISKFKSFFENEHFTTELTKFLILNFKVLEDNIDLKKCTWIKHLSQYTDDEYIFRYDTFEILYDDELKTFSIVPHMSECDGFECAFHGCIFRELFIFKGFFENEHFTTELIKFLILNLKVLEDDIDLKKCTYKKYLCQKEAHFLFNYDTLEILYDDELKTFSIPLDLPPCA